MAHAGCVDPNQGSTTGRGAKKVVVQKGALKSSAVRIHPVRLLLAWVAIWFGEAQCLGFSWMSRPTFVTNGQAIVALAYGNGSFVAAGDGGSLFTSSDATNWTTHNAGTNKLFGVPAALVFANSNFVAVGTSGSNAVVQLSSNGVSWGTSVTLMPGSLSAVAYGNGTYVCAEQAGVSGLIAASADGVNWNTQVVTNASLVHSVAYGNATFVAPAPMWDSVTKTVSSMIFASRDGLVWTQKTTQPGIAIYSIAYGNGIFVGGGIDKIGAAMSVISRDGAEWTQPRPGPGRVIFANAWFLGGWGGTIASSADGIYWAQEWSYSSEHVNLSRWTYGLGTFLLLGYETVQSEDLSAYCLMSGSRDGTGAIRLTVTGGQTGRGYRLQGSTNLLSTNWVDLLSYTNSGDLHFLDPAATSLPQRSYRVVSP